MMTLVKRVHEYSHRHRFLIGVSSNQKFYSMKKILVATDFSHSASNAVNYAAHLAVQINASLVLFHSYAVPVIVAEAPVMMPSLEDVEKDCIKKLKHIEINLNETFNNALTIEHHCVCGFALEEINNYINHHHVDYIVAGMHGAGAISEKLIGSVTTSLMDEAKCPVICIHNKNKFESYKKIVFACDLGDFKNIAVLETIKQFVILFHAKLLILNVFNKNHSEPTITEAVAGLRLDQVLADVNHQLCYTENNDVIEGINEFVKEHKADLVIMMPRHHSFINKLFNEPHTKKMAFHSSVPLMCIHE